MQKIYFNLCEIVLRCTDLVNKFFLLKLMEITHSKPLEDAQSKQGKIIFHRIDRVHFSQAFIQGSNGTGIILNAVE